MNRFGGLFPKTHPLPGSLHQEWRRCGKATCRCATGAQHGPYWVRRWWEDGRQRKQYVRARDLDRTVAAVARWRTLHPPVWRMRQHLAQLQQSVKEVIDG
jgi:hypothetical protein